jgi:hypothetical protein
VNQRSAPTPHPQTAERQYYEAVIRLLKNSGLPFLVGGAHAFRIYTDIERDTKDFDVFLRRRDVEQALAVMDRAGFRTEMTDESWIAKAFEGTMFVDFIFAFGNGVAAVDDLWFDHARTADIFAQTVQLVSPEDMLWSKAFVMDRDRFDGADILHLMLRQGHKFDWQQLLKRFASHWKLLLIYIIYFQIVYPTETQCVPTWVFTKLLSKLIREPIVHSTSPRDCLGMLFSRSQYNIDFDSWNFKDGRFSTNANSKQP